MTLYNKNLLPILMIIASMITLFTFLRPQYSVIQSLRAEKARYETAVNNANEVRILRGNLLAVYDEFSSEDRERLTKFLPDAANGPHLINDFNSLAKIFGITLDTFSINENVGGNQTVTPVSDSSGIDPAAAEVPAVLSTATVGLNFSFVSRYNDFFSFLRELEKNLLLTDITQISIGRGGQAEDGDASLYNFTVTAQTYWIK